MFFLKYFLFTILLLSICRSYKEDQDPDYKLPEDDKDWLSDLEELEEVEDNLEEEIKALIEDAEGPVSESHRFGSNALLRSVATYYLFPRDEPVVSPVKVTLTPAKESADEERVEEKDEEVTLVDDGEEVDAPRRPLLWEVELLLTEQKEEDDEKDLEYVPPSTCLEISLDYDEYSDGEISDGEVQDLKVDLQTQPSVPSDYMVVWVKVDSPMERINRAKEERDAEEEVSARPAETGGKESGVEEKGDFANTLTLESDGAIKKSLSGCSFDGKPGLEVRRKSVGGNSSCSNLSAGGKKKMSANRKSSCSDVDAVAKPQREQKEGIPNQLEVFFF